MAAPTHGHTQTSASYLLPCMHMAASGSNLVATKLLKLMVKGHAPPEQTTSYMEMFGKVGGD